jgi:hypothetical protein
VIVRDDEYLDFSRVPESRGITAPIYWTLAIGLAGIFAFGGAVIFNASYGHDWPATHTLRTDLGPMTVEH